MSQGPGIGRRGRTGPSIGDVATLAGVSSQTVSRVSTGSLKVRPETRRRVLDAMEQLGYSPNIAARALRRGSFGVLGLIAHKLDRTGESRTIESVIEAAREHGYSVTLIDVESPTGSDIDEAVARLSHQAIDGLVIIRAEITTPTTLSLPQRIPVVVSDSRFADHYSGVGADQRAGSHAAVEHLLQLGHRTVHHIAGPLSSDPACMRSEEWRATLERHGRPVPEPAIGDWSAASGYRIGLRLALDPEVTAVYAANDEMAAGLYRALHENNRAVPDDVSVVGFDDIPLAEYLYPPLTTVQQDFHKIGRELVGMLLRRMGGARTPVEERVLVPAGLIVRASTAPPRRA